MQNLFISLASYSDWPFVLTWDKSGAQPPLMYTRSFWRKGQPLSVPGLSFLTIESKGVRNPWKPPEARIQQVPWLWEGWSVVGPSHILEDVTPQIKNSLSQGKVYAWSECNSLIPAWEFKCFLLGVVKVPGHACPQRLLIRPLNHIWKSQNGMKARRSPSGIHFQLNILTYLTY